jgi:two-component system, cell cycle response regulator
VLVLVADDDTTCRLVAKAAVEQLGHECLAAEDGARAWEILNDRPVDVLLTDWMMPGVDGIELCRRVRAADDRGYTYIIIATALSERDQIIEGMQAGADDYLTKPLEPFDVRTRLIAATRVTALHRQIVEFRDELERLNAEVGLQARTDPLTQLGNRLRLHEDLEAVHNRARRHQTPYSVALCDIDLFKRYNDTNGHLQGDEALRLVAAGIAQNCRASERAYRYGGEEFIVIYSDEARDGASVAGERLRRTVEELAIPLGADRPGVITISVGIATWDPAVERDTDEVLKEADAALYQAKERGRNRAVAHDPRDREVEALLAGAWR